MSIMTLLMEEGGVTAVQQFLWHPGQFTVSITTILNSCLCVHFLYFSHDNFLVSCRSKLTNLPARCRLSLWSCTFDICPSETFQPEQKALAGLKEDVGRARLSQPPLSSVLPFWSIPTQITATSHSRWAVQKSNPDCTRAIASLTFYWRVLYGDRIAHAIKTFSQIQRPFVNRTWIKKQNITSNSRTPLAPSQPLLPTKGTTMLTHNSWDSLHLFSLFL